MIKLNSLKSNELNKKQIREICILKDSLWKYGLNSQLKWFKENLKSNDLHNCLYLKEKLVGYTCLRNRKFSHGNKNKSYLLFDSLIISKNLRKKKLSYLLMLFNNNIIKSQKKISFLICDSKLQNFYKKFNWKNLRNNQFIFLNHKLKKKHGMIYNLKIAKKIFNKKNLFYFYK